MTAFLIGIIVICLMAEFTEWKNNHKDPNWRRSHDDTSE